MLRDARENVHSPLKVDETDVDRIFDGEWFSHGPVLPFAQVSDMGLFQANVVLLRKRQE